jgi:hypothetical protein
MGPEHVFVNVYGAQESIPRNRCRYPMLPGEPVQHIELSYRSARLGFDFWSPQRVYKYGLRAPSDKYLWEEPRRGGGGDMRLVERGDKE